MLRVVLSGVESVGKSVLAGALAERFGGVLVPEFGRTYTEGLDRPLTLADHHAIAARHREAAARAAAGKPRLLIEDTDIVMTTAWATMLFGGRDAALAALPSEGDLHLWLKADVPFVADPVRMFGGPDARGAFEAVIGREFRERGIGAIPISGTWDKRTARAMALVENALG
jgi:nicotinamide riboside kinase